jgi:hypothetical protein
MKKQTEKTMQMLLSGKHPNIKKYAGKQVFVIANKVFPIKAGKKGFEEFKELQEKYGESPVVTFVPRPGATYILFIQ